MSDESFRAFFERATGRSPYDYQRSLGETASPPSVLEVPTGSGKTHGLLVSWLYARRVLRDAPRRLVYALPMRTLVEQTRDVAVAVRARLGLSDAELQIHVLMGGEAPSDWREHPERDQVLIGTIDVLLSRALNRGYGESRFAWPVSFGLLNSDCRWVLDEVQLMGPARATSAQLDGLRAKLGTALPIDTIWASATVDRDALVTVDRPALGEALGLSARDRSGPLARRLEAPKIVERADLTATGTTQLPRAIARALLARHQPAARSIAVLNRVALARAVFDALTRETRAMSNPPELVLLHSRFRPPDRRAHMAEALRAVEGDGGRIVVSTQVIEAGVDTSAQLLATETAPFSSIVQRIGRCNRNAEFDQGSVLWLDRGELDARGAAPYEPADITASREMLASLIGESASPATLAELHVPETRERPVTLRRRDLVDLFDTAPDLSGMDVDVSRFIREADERAVSVFFRALNDGSAASAAEQPAPDRDELVDVPLEDVRGRAADRRSAWAFDHVDGYWRPAFEVRPGVTLMLDAGQGGYDPLRGWTADPRDLPEPLREGRNRQEAIGSDPATFRRAWVTLHDHLAQAAGVAAQLLDAIPELDIPDGGSDAVTVAAALHDVGKAHPVFQATLMKNVAAEEQHRRESTQWAKSAVSGARHGRRHFRHELASALGLRASRQVLDGARADLVIYLVAAHHGRVRLSIRPAPQEQAPPDHRDASRFALGIAEGDELPSVDTPRGQLPAVTLDLACMEIGGGGESWTELACGLRDDPALGPFRLAFLEALVRIADWRASEP
ncbi:MAG: type I-G CRISPR-associated helicase/endonuclease Cas3g [Solirubrobacteraceae bacterium]